MILRIRDQGGLDVGEAPTVTVNEEETVALDSPGEPLGGFGISGCEGLVHRIRVL